MDSAGDWNRADWPKLWLYNLHYFDDLVADGAEGRADWHRALISRWIAENLPAAGNGWEPYPISLRLVNWCKWLLAGNEPVEGMLDSMAVQARYLSKRLERHLLGNHLWANLKALIFVGTFFEGRDRIDGVSVALNCLPGKSTNRFSPTAGTSNAARCITQSCSRICST